MPLISDAVSIPTPPMWAIGIAIGNTSSGFMRIPSITVLALAITEKSVWRMPLGSAVVPDE